MEEKGQKSVMDKVSSFIVDKRNIIFVIYAAALIFSLVAQNWVEVCDDLTDYLSEDTATKQGLEVMEREFVTYSTSEAMAANVTLDEAEKISDIIENLDCVSMVDFENTDEYYTNGCALFKITLNSEDGSYETEQGYEEIRAALADYDMYYSESYTDSSKSLENEMSVVLIVAAVIIVTVLLLTSKTWMEVPVLLITFVAAAFLNKGTNFLLGEISFVSNSVTVVLQLALSIDYAIIMIHHYSEERETHGIEEAVARALAVSIPEISSSSLTTVSGLMAMMFMQFKIGFDLGLCLIKAIIFSLFCVFTLMPCLLCVLGKYIDKTPHKSFLPDVSFLGDVVYKLRMVMPPIFTLVILAAYFVSSGCPYVYNDSMAKTYRKNETQTAKEMIEENFGETNLTALMVPEGDYEREKALCAEIAKNSEVTGITALSTVEAKDGYVLTDSLSPREFAEIADVDTSEATLLYAAYAAENEDYSNLLGNLKEYCVPLIDMFMFLYDVKEDGYITLDEDLEEDLDDMYLKLDSAKKQLEGENFSRILIYTNLPTEGDETYAFIDGLCELAGKFYDESYIAGNSTSSYDLKKAFDTDNVLVSVLSILFVLIVLFFTFKSAGMPVLLIAVIQGSIWINFSVSTITNSPIFFLSYLVVSSIQMGANIDYAIVISSRYMELKGSVPIKEAMRGALNFAFPTVLTSGSILASAGLLIGLLSTTSTIVAIGITLCRGTALSMFLVMCVLPEILLLGDTIIEKTSFTIKVEAPLPKKRSGYMSVNGRISGHVNGYINAEVKGYIRGDIEVRAETDTIKESEDYENA